MSIDKLKEFHIVKAVIAIKKQHVYDLRNLQMSFLISEELLTVEEYLLKLYAKAYFEYDKGDAAFSLQWSSLIPWEEILFVINCGTFVSTAMKLKFNVDSLFKVKEKVLSKVLNKTCTVIYAKRFITAVQILRFYYELFNNYSNMYPVVRFENLYTEITSHSTESSEDKRTSVGSDKRTNIYYSKNYENTTSRASERDTSESSSRERDFQQVHQFEFYKGMINDVCDLCYLSLDDGSKCIICGEIFHKICSMSGSHKCSRRKQQKDLEYQMTALEFVSSQNEEHRRPGSYNDAKTCFNMEETRFDGIQNTLVFEQGLDSSNASSDKDSDQHRSKLTANKSKLGRYSLQNEHELESQIGKSVCRDILDRYDSVNKNDTIFRRINATGSPKILPRRLKNALKSKPSVIADWVVPLDAITIGETIKMNRFGTMKDGIWHGNVSVIILKNTDMGQAEEIAFRQKIFQLRRTRHTNLGLFMGVILESPVYGIITSLNQGYSLYDIMQKNLTNIENHYGISIIQQTAQGLGYLHSRGIIHNNLNSKTVILEGTTVKLTEFGLVTKENQIMYISMSSNRILLPRYWLVYQPPEVLRLLSIIGRGNEFGALTENSDIYYLGIMWKEILDKNFMKSTRYPECFIYQICSSIYLDEEPIAGNIKLVKTLAACLQYNPEERPSSGRLIEMLQDIPKLRMIVKAISEPMKTNSLAM